VSVRAQAGLTQDATISVARRADPSAAFQLRVWMGPSTMTAAPLCRAANVSIASTRWFAASAAGGEGPFPAGLTRVRLRRCAKRLPPLAATTGRYQPVSHTAALHQCALRDSPSYTSTNSTPSPRSSPGVMRSVGPREGGPSTRSRVDGCDRHASWRGSRTSPSSTRCGNRSGSGRRRASGSRRSGTP